MENVRVSFDVPGVQEARGANLRTEAEQGCEEAEDREGPVVSLLLAFKGVFLDILWEVTAKNGLETFFRPGKLASYYKL